MCATSVAGAGQIVCSECYGTGVWDWGEPIIPAFPCTKCKGTGRLAFRKVGSLGTAWLVARGRELATEGRRGVRYCLPRALRERATCAEHGPREHADAHRRRLSRKRGLESAVRVLSRVTHRRRRAGIPSAPMTPLEHVR